MAYLQLPLSIYDACICFHINTDVWEKITQETKNTFLNILFCQNIKSLFQEEHKLLYNDNLFKKFDNSAPCSWSCANCPFFVGPDFKSQLSLLT